MASAKLERKQELFVASLLTTASIAEAARKVKVSENTALRWLQIPEVQAQYRALRRQVVEHALAQLQSATSAAVITLVRNLRAESAGVQVRAATAILQHAIQAVELVDLAERLEQLEQLVAAQQSQPHTVGAPAIAGLRTMRAGGGGSGRGGVAS